MTAERLRALGYNDKAVRAILDIINEAETAGSETNTTRNGGATTWQQTVTTH